MPPDRPIGSAGRTAEDLAARIQDDPRQDRALTEVARGIVTASLGARTRIVEAVRLPGHGGGAVLRITLGDRQRLVLELGPGTADAPTSFRRIASVMALARSAGVPVAEVLAADDSTRAGRPHLLREHVPGVPWRTIAPQLGPAELAGVHAAIATAVLALHTVRLSGFGDLDHRGRPANRTLLDALHHRAEVRIRRDDLRSSFARVLDRDAEVFTNTAPPTLCHDDLHHDNVLVHRRGSRWTLNGLVDWAKAWAGPAESDVARMTFWDDMTGPGFWAVYRAAVPGTEGEQRRTLIHQLLWCLEYEDRSARHLADTAALRRRLGV